MREVYLLRHGHSIANYRGLVTGNQDDVLTEVGLAQARAGSRHLDLFKLRIDDDNLACYVSDWQRARETAALVAPGADFKVDARLGETKAGQVADWTIEQFKQEYPDFWRNFDPNRPYPDGESHQDLFERVRSWLLEIELLTKEKFLVVTHAGPICCLLHFICGVDMVRFPMFMSTHVSLTKLEQPVGGFWRLAFFAIPVEVKV